MKYQNKKNSNVEDNIEDKKKNGLPVPVQNASNSQIPLENVVRRLVGNAARYIIL
jgi:hypothetical protein